MSDKPIERKLLEALRFPTSVIRKEVDFTNCRNSGGFQRDDEECITCYQTPECEWLLRHDDLNREEARDVKQLAAALQFASDYMHAHLYLKRHAPEECPCDACTWWRDSQILLTEILNASAQTA